MLSHDFKTILRSACALSLAAMLINCSGRSAPTAEQPAITTLNDTGVKICLSANWEVEPCDNSALSQQDGAHGRDARAEGSLLVKSGGGSAGFDFTKLANDGSPLAIDASEWACVRDNVTGLIWEAKSADSQAVNYKRHTYTWYEPSLNNGGVAGVINGGTCAIASCDTQAYQEHFNNEAICGISHWRLPTVSELLSIADQSQANPPLDTQYFPQSDFNAHWTRQTVAGEPDFAWYVYFTAAGNGKIAKDTVARIRLVAEDLVAEEITQ